MARLLTSLFAALSISGCAVAPVAVEQQDISKIRNVAVVSMIGDKFHMVHVAIMVFGNRRSELAATSWGIDDAAESMVKATLEKHGYRPTMIGQVRPGLVKAHSGSLSNPINYEQLAAELRSLPGHELFDAFVVLYRQRNEDRIGLTNQFLEGIGLYSRPRFQGSTVAAYAWYGIAVVQGKSFRPLAQRIATIPRQKPGFLEPDWSLPFKVLPGTLYKEEESGLTSDEVAVVRQAVSDLLRDSIPRTLEGLGLVKPSREK